MKIIMHLSFLLLCPLLAIGQVDERSELYQEILATDQAIFDSYNNCDLITHASYISEDLEFYHDRGGLSTDKDGYIKSIQENICNKVKRTLTPGTFEVHEIKGFGAVAMGKHSFYNIAEDSHSEPSKFIGIFKKTPEGFKMTRVISLH